MTVSIDTGPDSNNLNTCLQEDFFNLIQNSRKGISSG